MSRFVTQLVDTQPTIVVIAAHPIPPAIRAAWSRSDVVLEVVTPGDLQRAANDVLAAAYRVLFWLPDWNEAEVASQLDEVLGFVTKLGLSMTVVAPWQTGVEAASPRWKSWQVQSELQQRQLRALRQKHPQLKWILGQDIVMPRETKQTWSLAPMVSEIQTAQPQIIDPQLTLFPQDWVGFWKAVFELSSDPNTPSTVLQGKRVVTSVLAQKLKLELHRQTGVVPEIVIDAVRVTSRPDFVITTIAASFITDEQLIEQLLQIVPEKTPTNKDTKLSPTQPLSAPASVAHAISPPPPQRPIAIPPHPMPQRRSLPPKVVHPPAYSSQSTPKASSQQEVSTPPPVRVEATKPEAIRTDVLDQEVHRLFQNRRQDKKTERVQDLTRQARTTIAKTRHRQKVFWGGVAAGAAGLVVIGVFGVFWLSIRSVEAQLLRTLAPNNFGSVLGVATTSTTPLLLPNQVITSALRAQVSLARVVLDENTVSHSDSAARLGKTLGTYADEREVLDEVSQEIFATLTGQNEEKLADELTALGGRSQKLYELVAEIETTLAQLELPALTNATPSAPTQLATLLTLAKKQLTAAQLLQPMWPRLLGLEGTRTYAIVWQNSLELRPTGGFVQAVGVVDIDNGRLQAPQVLNSYQIDQLAPGEVLPPSDLSTYLGEKEWFFRDSNWSPDFPTTAGHMRTYLTKSSQRQIDGIIGLTLPSVQALLEVTGPLDVPGYPGAVTADNLADRIVTHSSLPSAAATQTNDFQVALLETLLTKITQLNGLDSSTLLRTLTTQLAQGQLLVALTDSNEQATFQTLGWAGRLAEPLCPTQLSTSPCVIDVVSQVEANVGVNLANSTVQRQVAHEVTLTPERARHRRQITFINTTTDRTWPLGDYKTYLRLYVPTNAQLEAVSINGRNLSLDEVKRALELDKQVWGWLLTIPSGKQVITEVRYSTPLASYPADATSRSYGLLSQYQPGIDPVVTTTTIEYPKGWSPTLIAPSAAVTQSQVQFISSPALQSLQAIQFSSSSP